MSHDVFISFKNSGKDGLPTPDSKHARAVYEALIALGLKVFFSEESLAEEGHGNFSRTIETALESARILILVASCREHIESPWVETEWGNFLERLRSGTKEGEIFILSCGKLSPADLPLFLRRQQMFPADSLDKLVKFVTHAMPSRNSLRDFIRASLHCFHPEKDEDKAYVLTVHPGSDPETYHVTAYWGARTAKRLSSQMKAINVSADAAQLEVEKAKREKLRCGYVETPFAKILTNEARSHISAALGLHEAPGKAKKPVAAKRKNATQDLVPVKPSRGTKVAAKTASAKAQAQRKPASKKTMSAAK
jgi:predicted DNA-binding WGR domain protein